MSGIAEMITALTPPGSAIVISPPVYAPFFFRISFTGRRVAEAPLRRRSDGGYDLDPEALDAVLGRGDVSAYVLCSPHNPVGRVWSAADLRTVADLCQAHGKLVLAHEIHAPLALPGAAQVPFLSLDHPATERAIAFTSASKGWNLPGLKAGLAVAGSDELAGQLAERWEALLAGQVGILASVAGVRYLPPEASFLGWLDCTELGLGDDPAATFLDRGRVALSPGPDFGTQGSGFARLNMGTSPELLGEAVHRMSAALHHPR